LRSSSEKPAHILRLRVDAASARRIIDRLADGIDLSGLSIGTFENKDYWTIEVRFPDPPDRDKIAQWVSAAAGAEIARTIAFETKTNKDWVAESLAGLAPVRVGRFVVHGAHDRHRVAPNRIGIEIEAALAFGTGHHGSTRGCLAAIGRAAHGRPRRILDLGTGSGVLAIATARTLRRLIVACDLDPVAVAAARANARGSRAGAFVRVVRACGVVHPAIRAGAPYDLVLANLLLPPLQLLARPVRSLLAPGATVVLSGLLPAQANAAFASYRAQGLVLQRRELIENWVTLTLTRP
jgi:ribosomal protein L11 methyltransferase